MNVIKFKDYVNESKMYPNTIPNLLSYIENLSNNTLIFIDTETTGLKSPKYIQLTQVAAISYKYDFNNNSFNELSSFNEKIKLTDDTKKLKSDPNFTINKVLSFNHYGKGDFKYKNEQLVLDEFYRYISQYKNSIFVIQNASFDMKFLNGRYKNGKFTNQIFDTKVLIQMYLLPLYQKLAETDNKYKEKIYKIGTSIRDNGLISSSMSVVGPSLGIDMTNYHDALTDIKITTNMFQKIIDLLKKHKDIDISKYQIERIKSIKNSKK